MDAETGLPDLDLATSHPHDFVDEHAARKIRAFRGTIDERGDYLDEVYKSNASLATNIASDYRDRFVIELIQNAYDAHPTGTRDGRIEIILDMREGRNGTLFVANKGRPFVEGNVKDLCDIGLSRKPLGESIGNKGLGFRSVVQITDIPSIYSQSDIFPAADRFSGFCFRFAASGDYAALIDDSRHLQLARRDLPPFHIPVWLDKQTEAVRGFAKDGFSTVIELPLRDEVAAESVRRQFIDLRNQTVPMLLFLDRAASLEVRIVTEAGDIETALTLTRSEDAFKAADMEFARVDLGDAGVFLVTRRRVAEVKMKEAIGKAIAGKELNEHWERWEGDGDVALAVRLDAVVQSPRLFTFLPMGEQAEAPFPGHLHGSFFPSSNRKHLNARIRLNALLLEEATSLAADAIHHLVAAPSAKIVDWLSARERAAAVVDLLCWAQVGSLETDEDFPADLACRLAERFGVEAFENVPLVPCQPVGAKRDQPTWHPPAVARRWPEGLKVFSAAVATDFADLTTIRPIWDELGGRLERLDRYLVRYARGYAGPPQATERAYFASLVAARTKSSRRAFPEQWLVYFTELPDFMGNDGRHLAGLFVLLGDDGELHAAMPSESGQGNATPTPRRGRPAQAAVFSPPDRRRVDMEDDLDVEPPKSLSDRFAFLSPNLPWHGELATARSYLEQHRLVEEFDREAVLAHLSRSLQTERNKEVLKGGLRWAFQLWRQPRARGRAFRMQPQHRFRVPTLEGSYIPANEAIFSAGWPKETAGELLQAFLDAAPPGLRDVESLASRRIAAPDHAAFRGRWIEDWAQFLAELGVAAGLKPETRISRKTKFAAHEIESFSFLESYAIPVSFAQTWRASIAARDPSRLRLPSMTTYDVNGEMSWLPGQADIEAFSPKCASHYAALVLRWLSLTSNLPPDIEIHHHYSRWADRRDWPSPVAAFLQAASWFPVEDPGPAGGAPVMVRATDVWMFDSSGDRFVPYLRRPESSIRRRLEGASEALVQNLRVHTGLNIFNDPDVLPAQLEFLVQQYASEGFDRHFERHLLNLYNRTWLLLANQEQGIDPKLAPSRILARRATAIQLVHMSAQAPMGDEVIYVRDTEREGDVGLLEASGQAFFDLKEAKPHRIGDLFEMLYGDRVRRLSKVSFALLADGQKVEEGDMTPILTICPPLRAMVAVTMEALSGTEAQALPSDRSLVLARLERLKARKAEKLGFNIDGIEVSADQDTPAFHFKLQNGEALVVVGWSGHWSWEIVDRCMPAVAEALGHRSLTSHLRLLVAHLRNVDLLTATEHSLDDLDRFANILQLSRASAAAALSTLSAGLERQSPWIRAVLHLVAGPRALSIFDEEGGEVFKDAQGLELSLAKLLTETPITAHEVIALCRTALGPRDFREGLGLGFSDFNASLISLGLDPETYPDAHKSRLENFIRLKEIEITDCLRSAFAAQLEKREPVEGYADLRARFRSLLPDPAWLLEFEEPPETALEALVSAWLVQNRAPPLGGAGKNFSPLSDVRKHNNKILQDFAQKAGPILRAWCAKNDPNRSIPSFFAGDSAVTLRKRFDDIGVLDFKPLDDSAIQDWLFALELWPTGMALSLDLPELGLSEAELSTENLREREARDAQKRETRSVPFNGRLIDPVNVDLLAISEELSRALSSKTLGKSLAATTDLADARGRPPNPKTKEAGDRPSNSRRARLPEEKTDLIGRLGELTVYHWLRKTLPNQDIDAAWLSENGEFITGRKGRDGLGYDFEVSYRNQIWRIEVKASLNDPQSFEMGETEVAAARMAARSRSGVQYKIAYISHVSEPTKTTIEMIPNPMSDEGARVLELRGEGIRYSFRRY
ncbi:sacsin N-terminal ATP-binding-like domain-containing protein [Tabrizicola sp. BL-A-41-H6]|uniref:sacsin N-terminal ATP-binding-like domain-containing protein n=1 Tax=Tabrizicola sp. BL-A-41-H6 TaxID=3421107 RepID=UPI003D66D923